MACRQTNRHLLHNFNSNKRVDRLQLLLKYSSKLRMLAAVCAAHHTAPVPEHVWGQMLCHLIQV
jgi:hypothetical protein